MKHSTEGVGGHILRRDKDMPWGHTDKRAMQRLMDQRKRRGGKKNAIFAFEWQHKAINFIRIHERQLLS